MSRNLLLAPLALLAACQAGPAGTLVPVIEGAVAKGPGTGEAVVQAGGVSATVSARWAAEASQSATITYRNGSAAPIAIGLTTLKLDHRLGTAVLWSASDMTGIDRAAGDNRDPPILYDLNRAPPDATTMTLKPGERRFLSVGFTRAG